MEYTEIIIDDLYQLELGDKAILIPTTYELIDIKDLNRRSGSKTKTIVIPRTKQNDKIFGFSFNINAKNAFDKYGVDFVDLRGASRTKNRSYLYFKHDFSDDFFALPGSFRKIYL